MVQSALGNMQHLAAASVGLSLLLLATLTYTRLAVVDPYSFLFGSSRGLADAAAFAECICLLAYSALALRGLSVRERIAAAIWATMGAIVLWIAAYATREDPCVFLGIYVGVQAWWLAALLAVAAYPAVRVGWNTVDALTWKQWWMSTGICIGVGLLLYLMHVNASPLALLAKIVLLLIIPAICFIVTVFWYRGRYAFVLRGVAGLCALVTVAVATIR